MDLGRLDAGTYKSAIYEYGQLHLSWNNDLLPFKKQLLIKVVGGGEGVWSGIRTLRGRSTAMGEIHSTNTVLR